MNPSCFSEGLRVANKCEPVIFNAICCPQKANALISKSCRLKSSWLLTNECNIYPLFKACLKISSSVHSFSFEAGFLNLFYAFLILFCGQIYFLSPRGIDKCSFTYQSFNKVMIDSSSMIPWISIKEKLIILGVSLRSLAVRTFCRVTITSSSI